MPRKIVLVVSSLSGGGAERAVVELAAGFSDRGHSVSVVTWNRFQDDAYTLDQRIKRFNFDRMSTNKLLRPVAYFLRLLELRRVIKRVIKPDFVISVMDVTNQTAILATLGLRLKTIATQHVDPRWIEKGGFFWNFFSETMYGLANRVIYLDQQQANWAKRKFPRSRIIAISNPLPPIQFGSPDEMHLKWINSAPHIAVAMGRLVPQKGFDLLLQAFSIIKDKHLDWNLIILGEGEERRNLESQIASLGLSERVILAGFQKSPHDLLVKSDLFVVSSRWEGQSLALAEAMACGLACVSFDCPSGPALLLEGGKNGHLIQNGNVERLADSMEQLMGDADARQRLGQKAKEAVHRLMNREVVLDRWEQLFLELS